MKKILVIVGSVLGGLLVLCVGGGIALYLLVDTTYAAPDDPCELTALDSSTTVGRVTDRRPVDEGCVLTLDAGGSTRTLTVVIHVSTSDDASGRYDAARQSASASGAGATIADASDVGSAAFTIRTGQLTLELHYRDGNLYVALSLVAADGLPPEQALAYLTAIAKAIMSELEPSSSDGDWD